MPVTEIYGEAVRSKGKFSAAQPRASAPQQKTNDAAIRFSRLRGISTAQVGMDSSEKYILLLHHQHLKAAVRMPLSPYHFSGTVAVTMLKESQ